VEEVVPLPAALTASRKQQVLALAGRRNAGENLSTAACRAWRFKLFPRFPWNLPPEEAIYQACVLRFRLIT
jgi:hypothetical protein